MKISPFLEDLRLPTWNMRDTIWNIGIYEEYSGYKTVNLEKKHLKYVSFEHLLSVAKGFSFKFKASHVGSLPIIN